MQRIDHYALKNTRPSLKIAFSLGWAACLILLAWSWFIVWTVVSWNSSDLTMKMSLVLGQELADLATRQRGDFAFLLGLQAVAYGGLWAMTRLLLRRAALRRRMKALLSFTTTFLVGLQGVVWLTLPFSVFAQKAFGPIGLASAFALLVAPLPGLFQLWFYRRWTPPENKTYRVLLVGGGFAGLYTAMALDKSLGYHKSLEITLVDQKNYFLFPPLLPSAAVGTIETRQVTTPYRRIFETTNIRYIKGTVTAIDPKAQTVSMQLHGTETTHGADMHGDHLNYDYLVLAPGSTTQTFNTPGADEFALFVRELRDAMNIRSRIIDCFERAAATDDVEEQRELLRFAIVGGGPTGVEIATEIQDLIHEILLKRYPEIDPSWPEVTLIQSGPQILPGWPPEVVRLTTEQLGRLGVKLVLNSRVTRIAADAVSLKDREPIRARTCLWCAGVKPSPLLKTSGLPLDASGRVPITDTLTVAEFPNVFVLGDSAQLNDSKTGKPLPPLGQVAFQQGPHAAKNLVRLLSGEKPTAFRYFNFGSLVSVGEHYAAVTLLGVRLWGIPGWIVWRTLYLSKIVGMSNRLRILLDWTLDLLIERSIAQLQEQTFVDTSDPKAEPPPPVMPA